MIARSIKLLITGPDSYIGHSFVITTLCQLREVPTEEDTDEISSAGQLESYKQHKQPQQHHSHHHSQQHSRSSI
ncbi:hypothetical protein A2U01_0080430, partial [Trifolium medium]|nr:hypothetical protein [Trifolium medium]